MPVSFGGGAATASGAAYQSSVAAYLLVSIICDIDIEPYGSSRPSSISFETANPVDDISVSFERQPTSYLQVKRALSFSVAPDQEFYSCLDQFVRQWIADKHVHSLVLVTTSESSKRLTVVLPAVVAAISSGSENDFRRDQNKSFIRDLDLVLDTLQSIYLTHTSAALAHNEAIEILKKIRVLSLDLSAGSSLEQAIYMILSSKGCRFPSLFWGKLISDCSSFAAARRTLSSGFIRERYTKLLSSEQPSKIDDGDGAKKLFEIVSSGQIPTGREVVIGTIRGPESAKRQLETVSNLKINPDDICIFDFYRFDDECQQRIKFKDGTCFLQNGLEISLLGRTATFTGLERFIERQNNLKGGKSQVLFFRSNIDDDLEEGACAKARRDILEKSVPASFSSLRCCHCEKPISSNDVDFIEIVLADGVPAVALSHQNCTKTDDRIIGTIYSDFFEKYEFLRGFDSNAWFRNINRGQGAYLGLHLTKSFENRVMTWSGRSVRASTGTHVVEFGLDDGTSEFSYHRGQLDRYSKLKADGFAAQMCDWIRKQREKRDPLCYSSETLQFGSQSTLLKTIGVTERLRLLVNARVRPYRSTIAQRYDVRDNWFTPVAYLRALPDEVPVGLSDSLFLITEPLKLDRFLANWQECGMSIPDYEVPILATDEEFDEFAREVFGNEGEFLIDPLFGLTHLANLTLISGTRLVSMASIEKRANRAKPG
jgi:hypothetical protein